LKGRNGLDEVRDRTVEIDHAQYPSIGSIGRICQSDSKTPNGGRIAPYLITARELRELRD
jgi:hypothetical protein